MKDSGMRSIGAIGASSYIGILTRTAFFMSLISGSTIPDFLKVLGTVLSGAQRSGTALYSVGLRG